MKQVKATVEIDNQGTVMETLPIRQSTNMDMLISQALDKNVSVETLERLLAMAQQLDIKYAKEQFILSMSRFQAECPIIINTKEGSRTKTGTVAFKYAPLESIIAQVRPLLARHNLSYSVNTATDLKGDTVTSYCTARHIAGHAETTEFTTVIGEGTSLMTKRQVVAGAHTFAKRYAFCNCFGIVTSDYDLDDNGNIAPATDEQVMKVIEVCDRVRNAKAWVCKRYNVENIEELNTEQATQALEMIERQLRGQ